MSHNFVPFSASAPGSAPAAIKTPAKILANPQSAVVFRPLAEPGLPGGPLPPVMAEPKVTLERDGSRVTGIKIQCVCGHTIELTCE